MSEFDVIVIGGGPGGYVAAIRAAQLGLKSACVEMRQSLGGTCLNVGCIPSKALLESSHLYHKTCHDLKDHGIEVNEPKIDIKKMIKRKEEVVETTTKGIEFLFSKNKVTWLKGRGSFDQDGSVIVTSHDGKNEKHSAKHVIIATGSEPVEIPSAKFDHKFIIDSTDALELKKVPKHLIVVGGGVIGLEMGSVWMRLGAKVTVIEAADKILGGMDKGVSTAMQKILEKQGMEFHLKTFLESTETKGKQVKVTCKKGTDSIEFKGDQVLIAVGRRPYTESLGLEGIGVELDDRKRIKVDHNYKTNKPGIYAIGDVVPGMMLAHKAEEEGVAIAEMIAGKSGHVNYDAIPGIVYTWPEIASVGKSEEELKTDKVPYAKAQFFFKANGRAKAMGETDGFVKILAHKETDRVLGAQIIGPMASELIAEITIGIEYAASAEDIARSVHAHPTLSEAIKEAALGIDGRMIHS